MQIGSRQEATVLADGDNSQQASCAWFTAGAALVIVVGLAFASLWTAGSGEQNFSVWDSCFWLNAGWRILHGQIPHTDFSLTTGTFLAYMTALGMNLKGPCVGSIAAGQAILGALLAIAAFAVLRRRTSPALALAASLFCALLVMATRQAGEAHDIRSHAFLYNRIAEGLLALFAWIVLIPPVRPSSMRAVLEFAGAGMLWALIVLTKFTYGLTALALLGVAAVWGSLSLRGAVLFACGVVATCVGFHVGLGLRLSDWMGDVTAPFYIGYESTQISRIFASAVKGLPALAVLGGLWALWQKTGPSRRRAAVGGLGVLLLWTLAVLAAVASQQRQEYPFAATVAFALYALIQRQSTGRTPGKRAALALLAVAVLPQGVNDARSLVSSQRSAQIETHPSSRIEAHPLSDFRLAPRLYGVADQINDGLALVKAHAPQNALVTAFDYADAFAFALQRPPPRGGLVFWYPGFNFGANVYQPAESLFRDRPWVLIAQEARYRDPILQVYGEWLAKHYTPAAESRHYRLWAPRPQE